MPTDATSPSQARIRETGNGWTITLPSLSLGWERDPAGDIRLVSLQTHGREWIADPIPMFTQPGMPSDDFSFPEVTAGIDDASLRLTGTLLPVGCTIVLTYTPYETHSVVLCEMEVLNETDAPVEIGSLPSLRLATARDTGAQFNALAGGRWDESMPPRGYRLQSYDLNEIGRGISFGAADDGRSSGEHVPWFALTDATGGLLAGLVWSGRWQLDVVRQADANELTFGISNFAHRLEPGERLSLPSVVLAGYAGTLDDGANTWRRWITDHWMPPVPESWPWIQYNHWYAYYGDINAQGLLEEARLAANLGCEVFVIDDGWFRGRRPDSYYAGWGDWVEDRSKFPDGIHAFGEHIREMGMKFGLWVEPERADDNGSLLREHPDWVSTVGGEPIYRPGPNGNEGVHLCLGNPEVQQWMTSEMIRVVREYGVDWLKWDYNMGYGRGCDAPDHGHQPGDGQYAHTQGLYTVLEELRATCPDLVIENCASGGHRVDMGTLRHTHTNWVSDYTHRAASCRQHAQGAGLFLPLAHVNTWALKDRDITGFRSRMGGALGVSSFMGEWSEDERATFRQAIEEYKRLRPFLQGERYLLTGPWHGDWDIWQIVHPSGNKMAMLAFRERGAISEARVIPRVLDPNQSWLVEQTTGNTFGISGADLASQGLVFHLPGLQESGVTWLTAIT